MVVVLNDSPRHSESVLGRVRECSPSVCGAPLFAHRRMSFVWRGGVGGRSSPAIRERRDAYGEQPGRKCC